MGELLMPVTPSYMASWYSHTRRSPKSSEPGTDMFVPIGTPIYAPGDGVIYGTGNTIGPATGRWVGIDLANGMRFRCMHLSRLVNLPNRVKRGALIGYSGASGYGHEDWSHLAGMPAAHTHVTLWPTRSSRFGYQPNGTPYTVDFMNYVGGASGGSVTEEDDMTPDESSKLNYVFDAIAKPYGSQLDAIVNIIRAEIAPAIASIAAGGILYPGQPYLAFEALANVVRADGGKSTPVDPKALATALAPLLSANLSVLSDADVQRLAKATADEQAKRLAS